MSVPKHALLIVDMQKDVMTGLVKTGLTVIPAIKKALDAFRDKQQPVIFLKREHRKSGIDVELFRLPMFEKQPFLVVGSKGAEMVDELTPLATEYSVNKQRFSGFFQSDLLMILMRLGVTSLVVCGVQTPNCIRGTVTDGLSYDYDVTLLDDATAAQSPEVHQANVFDMRNMGVNIKTVDEFLQGF